MILAVDFDGTLSLDCKWPAIGTPNEGLLSFLKKRQKMGDKLILWTCRAGKELADAVEWCKDKGLSFDAVNDNIPEIVELYGMNSRKITCDYYIDDKAKTAMKIRLENLCVGAKGYTFNTSEIIDFDDLLENKNAVFELEGLADDSDKAFSVGLLVIFINEYRQVKKEILGNKESGLKHLLVIEEAHTAPAECMIFSRRKQ